MTAESKHCPTGIRQIRSGVGDHVPITVLDLFAGCGGLTEGFHQFRPVAGRGPVFRSVGAVEWDRAAAASYAMNFGASSPRPHHVAPPEIFCTDIVDWHPRWARGEVDVVVGGPPCQGFSALNRHKVRPERNDLWREFVRVVVDLQPQVFVIENVEGFVRSPEFENLQRRIGSGDLVNYQLVPPPGTKAGDTRSERARKYVLNAADYGSHQARRRAVVIGVRADVSRPADRLHYPVPTHSRGTLVHRADHVGLVGEATGLAPWQTAGDVFAASAAMTMLGTELPPTRVRVPGIPGEFAGPYLTTDLHITRKPERISLARYRAIPRGGGRNDLRRRYVCRFENGMEIIVQKDGPARDDSGALLVPGDYTVVVNGVETATTLSVDPDSVVIAPPSGGGKRSGMEAFCATVVMEGDNPLPATLEYLSTPSWDAHVTGAGDVMGRVVCDRPSVTIRTEFFKPEKGRYLHPTENRPITHYEAARFQGFPDDFRWCGSKTDIARQIGNAVPIPLGRRIAESIYEYLRRS